MHKSFAYCYLLLPHEQFCGDANKCVCVCVGGGGWGYISPPHPPGIYARACGSLDDQGVLHASHVFVLFVHKR